jgi:predicted GNAT superfamily acetyltransferase
MLSIRTLMPADEDQVLEINVEAQPNVAVLDHVEFSRLMGLSRTHIVAADWETVFGYALSFDRDDAYDGEEFLELRSLISQPFMYIDQVAVVGSAQGTGIGRRLYKVLEHTAWERGIRCLCCEVNTMPPNPGSLAFHSRLGFSTLSSFATRDGRNVVLLEKRIPVAARL